MIGCLCYVFLTVFSTVNTGNEYFGFGFVEGCGIRAGIAQSV